ncbi:P2X purinoceptor 7-like [Protopterus annectens]|uniref:P2X purinoceptor 7-like n=1 Tax=Protopterus annectens TaxID=7888 RepID=UPI001CFC42EE|nr:P2X purinoceptor 7-like [Protopterus annectens]
MKGKTLAGTKCHRSVSANEQRTATRVSTGAGQRRRRQRMTEHRQMCTPSASRCDTQGTLEDRIRALGSEDLRKICVRIAERNPDILLEVLDSGFLHGPEVSNQHSPDAPDWCVCNRCKHMPTVIESVCCRMTPENCISSSQEMHLCVLQRCVLQTAEAYRRSLFGLPMEADENKRYRHTAYRQYIVWRHGRLGTGNRRVIPSCCVWRIRDRYPDANGVYTGFRPTRF